jgi:SAM-dependent methyltransferase
LAQSYRTLQKWDQWIAQQFLGHSLMEEEQKFLSQLLNRHYGKHALLIGVPSQQTLLKSTDIPCQALMSPFLHHEKNLVDIESGFHELPILTGSIDLVMLPHTLELVDNPRQLLIEACRIVKPEGLIVICGFNPYSAWGLKKLIGNLIHSYKIKAWLRFTDFALEEQKSLLFRPPVRYRPLYDKLRFLENMGNKYFPILGGAYILLARAKVVPLTPIRMKWKQHLGGIRLPTTISGHIARQSK